MLAAFGTLMSVLIRFSLQIENHHYSHIVLIAPLFSFLEEKRFSLMLRHVGGRDWACLAVALCSTRSAKDTPPP